jgi:DNA replication protein DnaC
MTAAASGLQEAAVKQQCKLLRMPAVAAQCVRLAEEAVRAKQNHLGYLEALLTAELDERERNTVQRRIHEARLPRMKTLDEFDFSQSPKISPSQIQELAQGGYIERAEPVIFIGDCDPATFCTSSLHS